MAVSAVSGGASGEARPLIVILGNEDRSLDGLHTLWVAQSGR
jgi:hypothetical protein